MKTPANATQVGGTHYATEFQHWDYAWAVDMGIFPYQISKYISRHSKKGGLQDVQKAIHFAQKYIELLGEDVVDRPFNEPYTLLYTLLYNRHNPHVGEQEMCVVRIVAGSHSAHSIKKAISIMEDIAGQYIHPGYVNQEGPSPCVS